MKKPVYMALAAAALLAQPAMAEDVWITIGNDGLEALKHDQFEFNEKALQRSRSVNDVTMVKVNENQLSTISEFMHHEFNRCGGFIAHNSESAALKYLNMQSAASTVAAKAADYTIDNPDEVATLQNQISEARIKSTIQTLSSYVNRYYTTQAGLESAQWIKGTWENLASGYSNASVEYFNHSWKQPSVIMTVTGQKQPDEIIVLGAHLDSTVGGGVGENTSAPGADDDASGIATLTEVIRAITSTGYKPDKTVVFMGYAAEEVGLRGSNAIASSYKNQGKNVIGVFQLDMTNYKGSSSDIYIIDDYTNAAQNQFLENLVNTYQTNLTVGHSRCGYGCSDHAAWHNNGFVASFPFEATFSGSNPSIHTANDTLARSNNDATHAVKFAKLAAAYVAELAQESSTTPPDQVTETFSGGVGQNQEMHYGPFNIAPGSSVNVQMTGTNDADLYVNFGSAPTTSNWDCRPYKYGSSESCNISAGSGDNTVYMMVRGWSGSTSQFNLSITYTPK